MTSTEKNTLLAGIDAMIASPCSVSVNHGYAVGAEVEFAAFVRATQNNNQSLGPALAVTIA